jgi:ATP-dependent HslUV protease subunit HslV
MRARYGACTRSVLAAFAGAYGRRLHAVRAVRGQLEKHQGPLVRAAVELAKAWRTERSLRQLEALLVVADRDTSLVISGNGDVIEPEHDLIAIGSGGRLRRPPPRP